MTTSLNIFQTIGDAEQLLLREVQLSASDRATIRTLIDAVTMLSNRLKTDSSNSSIPPSLDPNRPRDSKEQRPGERRKPGGQEGHKGNTLKRVSNPNETVDIHVDRRTVPRGFYKTIGYETRQVHDINISFLLENIGLRSLRTRMECNT